MAGKKKRKPGRPRTTGRGTAVMVRMHEEQLTAVDAWARRGIDDTDSQLAARPINLGQVRADRPPTKGR